MADFVAAIDQGTTSTRCLIFDHGGRVVAGNQLPHEQILPKPGWVEHDPMTLWERSQDTFMAALASRGLSPADLAALGITNQRETCVIWNRRTGHPYGNAIVWQDMRTDAIAAKLDGDGRGEVIRARAGIPPATYFSAGKLQWSLDNDSALRADAEAGEALFGTVDSWLLWNLTGGANGGRHLTDVTNASRTMLMDVQSCQWDEELLSFFGIPYAMLPEIVPSVDPERFGRTCPGQEIPADIVIGSALGDQHGAMIGQVCLSPGEAKNTYGTGNFLLLNTGERLVRSKHGLLSTICYQLPGQPPTYALEGSIAVTGSAVQWLRDQLGIATSAPDVDRMAAEVPDSAGVIFVPAFSGLFAPYWRSDARGIIIGLSRFHTRAHLARATLEAICYQSRDVVEAMESDADLHLDALKVDGGVTASTLCMQIQADTLGIPVSKPEVAETTALGAAYAAGLAVGFWQSPDELRNNWREGQRWLPREGARERTAGYADWQRAVERSLGWIEL